MSQLKKGVVLSYLNIFLTNAVGIFLTPFMIHSLGKSDYGLYLLIGSFVTYISLMDLGLNNTIIRFVAKYRAEKDKIGEENFLATTMLIYFFISIIITIIGLSLYFNLESLFGKSLSAAEMVKAKLMFMILVFNMAITLPGGAFQAISSGYEQFVFPRITTTIRYVLRASLLVAILWLKGDSVSIVILDTVMNILFVSINMTFVFKYLKVKFKLHVFNRNLIKEIFSYSIWIFIYALVQQFQWQSGQVILGMKENTTTVAIFGVGVMLGTYYGAFAAAINSVLLPKATKMVVNNNSSEELTMMMAKIGRITFLLLNLILIGFITFGKEFIFLWVGASFGDSWLITLLIMLVMTIPLTQSFGNSILEASNKIRVKAILNLTTMTLGVGMGYFFSGLYGGLGMISCIVSAMFVNFIITNIYFVKMFNFKYILFFKEVFTKSIVIFFILLIIGWQINTFFVSYSWTMLLLKIGIVGLLYITMVYFIQLNKSEKQSVLKIFKRT